MAKKVALVFGIVFLVIGILAFISNPIVGGDGFFKTDRVHDVVHLLSGILLLAVSAREGASSMMLKILGVIYLLVTILGFVMGPGKLLGVMEINSMDNWLHLVLTAVFLWAGFMSRPVVATTPAPAQPQM